MKTNTLTRKDYIQIAKFFAVVFLIILTVYYFTPSYVWGSFYRGR